jgi:hypothetical protein
MSDSLNTGIGVVNAVVGYPCRAPRFGNFLAEEHKMMVFPRHFVHERTKALVGIFSVEKMWEQLCTAVKWQYL